MTALARLPSPPSLIGSQIGKYRLVRSLGSGGSAAVYLGEHVVLRQLRAVKVLAPAYAHRPPVVERFIAEAKALAALRHRNVLGVEDIGQLDSGGCYMILEYLEGKTLAAHALGEPRRAPLPPHELVHLLAQVACGLQAAHDRGIHHRDLKPDNIVLTEGGQRAVIIDFGTAHLTEELAVGLATKPGVALGTPQYMAPEQHRGERVTAAADVYALGVILYQLCTGGWFPYVDEAGGPDPRTLSPGELYRRKTTRPPIDPRRRVPQVAPGIVELVLACLEADPARRPRSARAFALALAERVPGDGYHPDGLDILRHVARPLLEVDNLLATMRNARPVATSRRAPPFALGAKIGSGGMAEVFVASVAGDQGFARQVAIKRVLPELAGTPGFVELFAHEARTMARLEHPNIVAVTGFDRDAEGRPYLVMEYVDGKDLASLAETGVLPRAVTVFIVTEVLHGLGYAHALLVHRDVSPHNVLLGWNGAVKVTDFGIAKAVAASGAAYSRSVKGNVQYMSPEQVKAATLDGRSDLFAVGVVLWELLAGRRLFVGTPREVMAQILFRDLPAPSTVRPVPADLDAVTMRLLERDPQRRFATAEAALDALARCADAPRNGRSAVADLLAARFPAHAPRRAVPRGATQLGTAPAPVLLPSPEPAARRTRAWIAAFVVSVLAGALAAGAATAL